MALTFGFYNSKNGDRKYDATQMSTLFNGIIRDGVFANYPNTGDALKTTPGIGLNVTVGPGRAWFNGTWTDNDGSITLPIDTAHSSLKRIDAVVLVVNKSANADNSVTPAIPSRANGIAIKKGTPASTPTRPTMVQANGIYQYALAYVTVNANATSISSGNINNQVGTSTPYITGPLENISAEQILANWNSQWAAYLASLDAQFSQYESGKDGDWNAYLAGKDSAWADYLDDIRSDIGGAVAEAVDNEYDSRIFVVHFYHRAGYECDCTPTEIESAISAGKTIKATYMDQNWNGKLPRYDVVPLIFLGAELNKHQVDPHQSPVYFKQYQFVRTIPYKSVDRYYTENLHISYGWHPINSTVIVEDSRPSIETFTVETKEPYYVKFYIENNVNICDRSFTDILVAYAAGLDIIGIYQTGSTERTLPDFRVVFTSALHEGIREFDFVGNAYNSIDGGGQPDVTYKCSINNSNTVSISSENYYRITSPSSYNRYVFYIDGDNQTCSHTMVEIVNSLSYGSNSAPPGIFYCSLNGQKYSSSNFVIHMENGSRAVDVTVTFIVAPDSASGSFEIIKAVIDANGVTVTSFNL